MKRESTFRAGDRIAPGISPSIAHHDKSAEGRRLDRPRMPIDLECKLERRPDRQFGSAIRAQKPVAVILVRSPEEPETGWRGSQEIVKKAVAAQTGKIRLACASILSERLLKLAYGAVANPLFSMIFK